MPAWSAAHRAARSWTWARRTARASTASGWTAPRSQAGDVVSIGSAQLRYAAAAVLEDAGLTVIDSEADLEQCIECESLPMSVGETGVARLVVFTPERTWEVPLDDVDLVTHRPHRREPGSAGTDQGVTPARRSGAQGRFVCAARPGQHQRHLAAGRAGWRGDPPGRRCLSDRRCPGRIQGSVRHGGTDRAGRLSEARARAPAGGVCAGHDGLGAVAGQRAGVAQRQDDAQAARTPFATLRRRRWKRAASSTRW